MVEKVSALLNQYNGEDDVFVHVTAVKDSGLDVLNEGDKVSFELVENKGRMAAEKLSMVWR